MDGARRSGERDSLAMARERVQAWWTAVLAGQADQSHPIQGANISAKVEGDTLLVSGAVPTQEDLEEIRDEVEGLAGHGITDVRVEVEVKPRNSDERGLLRQTLIGVFESAEQADFAAGYLEGHGHVPRAAMTHVQPDDAHEGGQESTISTLSAPFARQLRQRLQHGQCALIVQCDEVDAFRVRELLDEETRSLETLVLPPQVAHDARSTTADRAVTAGKTRANEPHTDAR